MKNTFFFAVLVMAAATFSGDLKHAISFSEGMAVDKNIYAPIHALSFYWLKNKGIHEVSCESTVYSPNNDYAGGMGLSYSFLFKTPSKWFLLGPTFGQWYFKTDHYGEYYCGGKGALMYGNKRVGLILQERILFGIDDDGGTFARYTALNTLSLNFMIML